MEGFLFVRYMENGSSIETPQEALQCIDIIFRHALSKQFVQVNLINYLNFFKITTFFFNLH